MFLNDQASNRERQQLLPFVMHLACADSEEVEQQRQTSVSKRTTRFMSMAKGIEVLRARSQFDGRLIQSLFPWWKRMSAAKQNESAAVSNARSRCGPRQKPAGCHGLLKINQVWVRHVARYHPKRSSSNIKTMAASFRCLKCSPPRWNDLRCAISSDSPVPLDPGAVELDPGASNVYKGFVSDCRLA